MIISEHNKQYIYIYIDFLPYCSVNYIVSYTYEVESGNKP